MQRIALKGFHNAYDLFGDIFYWFQIAPIYRYHGDEIQLPGSRRLITAAKKLSRSDNDDMEISKKPGSSCSKNSIFSQIKMLKIPYVVCYLGRKSVDVETLKRLRNTMMSDENSTEAANRYILSKVNKSFFFI